MPTCFVIQPFDDSGPFDKRYDSVVKPAIEAAGLEAYRVDRDPAVEVPIESIEDGIKIAAICVADISTNNPNVWYELGYAFAARRQVLLVCSASRQAQGYPFDIQHRHVLAYATDAPQDFQRLGAEITKRLTQLMAKNVALRQIAESQQVAPSHGLSQPELATLAALASNSPIAGGSLSVWSLRSDAERAGLTAIGFALGLRRLTEKGFIEVVEIEDERGDPFQAVRIQPPAWEWIESNESFFVLFKVPGYGPNDLETPF